MIYPQNFEQKIGFDSIRHLLKEKCLSTLGQERVDEMNFSESFKDINEWLEQVMEFMRIIQEEDSFPDQYFFDVRPSLKRIRAQGSPRSSHRGGREDVSDNRHAPFFYRRLLRAP